MKQTRILLVSILVFLTLGGWIKAIFIDGNGKKDEYKTYIENAEEYMDRGLYQKAIGEYSKALSIDDEENTWKKMLYAYEKRYEESEKIYDEYLKAAQQAANCHSHNPQFARKVVYLYLERDEYVRAYDFLIRLIDSGLEKEAVSDTLNELKYAYDLQWKAYTEFRSYSNGYYAVSETGVWTYITLDGSDTDFERLEYAGSVGEEGIRVTYVNNKGQLINANDVVEGIFTFMPENSSIFAEGLVAIMKGGKYSYYNKLGDKKFGDYEEASAFIKDRAAVKLGDWYLINKEGEKVSKSVYEDIVINQDLSYIKDGIMIAKKDGKYALYDSKGKKIGKFECDEIDRIAEDSLIAFREGEKWGFVNKEGKVIIEPQYRDAKSFSNGLAAVNNGEFWGFINKKGEVVIDYRFLNTDYFNSEACCMVETGHETWQLISLYIKK